MQIMTNEEAVKYLIAPTATSTKPSIEYLKQKEAYDLAIKALEEPKQGKFKCCIKIKDLISMLLEFDMNRKATIYTYDEDNIAISITDMEKGEEE